MKITNSISLNNRSLHFDDGIFATCQVINSIVFTKDLTHCGIYGMRRQYIIDNIKVAIKNIGKEELLNADEVFTTNAVLGINSIRKILNIKFSNIKTKAIKTKLSL